MSFLELPAELRLHIYSYIPFLSPSASDQALTLSPSTPLTPSITRTCKLLRHETISIYAANTHCVLHVGQGTSKSLSRSSSGQTDSEINGSAKSLMTWLSALGPRNLKRVRSFQFSQHWELSHPTRFQGHVGFYVRLVKRSETRSSTGSVANDSNASLWQCTTGTYPFAKDTRGHRLQSVLLLQQTVASYFTHMVAARMQEERCKAEDGGMRREDLAFVLEAMNVVAVHPLDAAEALRRKRVSELWAEMEQGLEALLRNVGIGKDETQRSYSPF